MKEQRTENREQQNSKAEGPFFSLFSFHSWLPREQRGFTLLLAAITSSIVLSLGAAIFAIAQKELALSSTGRESQFAFYAADTAAECALYWDVRFNYFATSSPSGITPLCDGQTLDAALSAGDRALGSYTMTFSYTPNGYCATVSVIKSQNLSTGAVSSVVHADGYSTKVADRSACAAAISTDKQALQRSVELHY